MMKSLWNAAVSAGRAVKTAVQKSVGFVSPGVLVGGASAGLALGSRAADATFTIDTTSIVSVISGGVTTISAIGIAVLSLIVVIKLFKWSQRVLGG